MNTFYQRWLAVNALLLRPACATEVLSLKHQEYVYVGEPIPKIDKEGNSKFIMLYQRSVFLSLAKRNLITLSQAEKCMEEIERQKN